MGGIERFDNRDNAKNYKAFIQKYMNQYDASDIYTHLRCRLAHNYTITGDLALTHSNPSAHNPSGNGGRKIINFENFLDDFRSAAEKYFGDLDKDKDLQQQFMRRVSHGLPGTASL